MDLCTNSDHKAVIAKMDLSYLITPYSAAEIKKENFKRTVFLYDKASKEDWENYRQELDTFLERKISIQDLQRFSRTNEGTRNNDRINEWWDVISNSIVEVARKHIPKKKVSNTLTGKKKIAKESRLSKTLTQLGRWISIGKINIKLDFIEDNIEELNEEIKYINEQHETYIDLAQSWSQELIEDLKGW